VAVLVTADQATPARHPAEGPLNHLAAWQDLGAFLTSQLANDLDDEVAGGSGAHQLVAVMGTIGKAGLQPGPALADRLGDRLGSAPAASCPWAAARLTTSRRPSVSPTMWRLRPWR